MSWTARCCVVGASLAVLAGGQLPPTALADEQPQHELHNITYRARVDGVARGATIVYKTDNSQVETANPAMLPGRTFEANAVLADPKLAGIEVSIQWPYSANLHCEILVDDELTAQADDFVAPRLLPANDDPGYGKLVCGSELNSAGEQGGNIVNNEPVAPRAPDTPPPA